MASKVIGPRGADNSGVYRRPRVVLRPRKIGEIADILGRPKVYPAPVRPVGADYSQTRCVGGGTGTLVAT